MPTPRRPLPPSARTSYQTSIVLYLNPRPRAPAERPLHGPWLRVRLRRCDLGIGPRLPCRRGQAGQPSPALRHDGEALRDEVARGVPLPREADVPGPITANCVDRTTRGSLIVHSLHRPETRDFVLSHTEVLAGPGWRAPPFCAGARAAPQGPRGCFDRSLRTLLGTGPVEARCRGHEGAGGRGRAEDVTGSLLAARPAPTLRGSSAMRAGGTAAPGGRA